MYMFAFNVLAIDNFENINALLLLDEFTTVAISITKSEGGNFALHNLNFPYCRFS